MYVSVNNLRGGDDHDVRGARVVRDDDEDLLVVEEYFHCLPYHQMVADLEVLQIVLYMFPLILRLLNLVRGNIFCDPKIYVWKLYV